MAAAYGKTVSDFEKLIDNTLYDFK